MLEPADFHLDRASVRASFDRASATYESAAGLQAQVAAELLGRLNAFGLEIGLVGQLSCRFFNGALHFVDLAFGPILRTRFHVLSSVLVRTLSIRSIGLWTPERWSELTVLPKRCSGVKHPK